jgi:hypothetical protein
MHMDHFDRLLEIELARLLDPIVEAPAPPRRRQPRKLGVLRALTGGLADGRPDSPIALVVMAEPVPVIAVVPTPVGTV